MTLHDLHHLVLDVPAVGDAEAFYCELFDLSVAFREGERGDDYGKVPDQLDWPAARERGVEPGMSFLRRDAFSLALVEDASAGEDGRLDHVALAVDEGDVSAIAARAPDRECDVDEREDVAFVTDRYGVEWELNAGSPPPACPFEDLPVDP